MRSRVLLLPAVLALLVLFLVGGNPLQAQSQTKPRVQARSLPISKTAPFALVSPAVNAGDIGRGHYPASTEFHVPALAYHGQRPGPVIAYIFHGFSSEDAFHTEMGAIFGALKPAQMQGTVLVLSLPSREACKPNCPPVEERLWGKIAPAVLNDARFVVEVHQHSGETALPPHAFVYKAAENARLANYVDSMARAALVARVVHLAAMDAPLDELEHIAPKALELEHPAISIETTTLEGNESAEAAQLRKGLLNLLRHLKMAPGAVSWQNSVKRLEFEPVRDLILRP